MTELIVALDRALDPISTMGTLYDAGVRWFKVGPMNLDRPGLVPILSARSLLALPDLCVFADFKLVGPRFDVRELVKRLADKGVEAASVFTAEAEEAAVRAAEGSALRVWRVAALTDWRVPTFDLTANRGHVDRGLICPLNLVESCRANVGASGDVIVPGVRISDPHFDGRVSLDGHRTVSSPEAVRYYGASRVPLDGHRTVSSPEAVRYYGASHAVVGRPIVLAADPAAVARRYAEALAA